MEITCGRCSRHAKAAGYTQPVKHLSVELVRYCHASASSFFDQEQEAEYLAEVEAERRNERFWEDRGWAEARADEEREARMGILSFADAWDLASPGTRPGYVA